MAGKYNNSNKDSSDFKFKNNDPFPKKKMKSTLASDYVKDQNIKKKTSKKVVKKSTKKLAKKVGKQVLKKVPGPIGTVARVQSIGSHALRIAKNKIKNSKNLVPLRKGVGFSKATKKQMGAFKKAMDLKCYSLKDLEY